MKPKVRHFNTGRSYAPHGQRISYCQIGNVVYVRDHTRKIYFRILDVQGVQRDQEGISPLDIMIAYDTHDPLNNRPTIDFILNLEDMPDVLKHTDFDLTFDRYLGV